MTDWLGVIGVALGLAASNFFLYLYFKKKEFKLPQTATVNSSDFQFENSRLKKTSKPPAADFVRPNPVQILRSYDSHKEPECSLVPLSTKRGIKLK